MLLTVISGLFVIGVLVIFHELGHFLIAKRFGVKVEEFGIGFGQKLLSVRKRGTIYRINLIPLGGYVKLKGEEDNFEAEDGFAKKSVWERFAIVSAGPLTNFFLALFIFCIAGMTFGVPTDKLSNIVWRVLKGSVAEKVGIRAGDRIIQIDDKKIRDGKDMIEIIHKSAGKRLKIKILRKNREIIIYATPKLTKLGNKKVGLLGFNPKPVMKRYGPVGSIKEGVKYTSYLTYITLKGIFFAIKMAFSGENPQVGGPILIIKMAGEAAEFGIGSLLTFIGFVSVNVGIIMLIPFPALDGGRLLFLIIEAIRKKRIPAEKEGIVHIVGFAFLLALMVLIIYSDIIRTIKGNTLPLPK